MTETKTAHGLKSERTDSGIVWHLMSGWRTITAGPSFATWTKRHKTFTNYSEAKAALRKTEGRQVLEVSIDSGGLVHAKMDSETAARLAGREQFGSVPDQQIRLADAIADAWYEAGCPRP